MTININNKYFYSENQEAIILLHLDFTLLLEDESFDHKNKLLDFLDHINANKAIKTLVICNDYPSYSLEHFKDKWDELFEMEDYETAILRVFRTYNQIFLKLKELEKVVISVHSKPINAMLFNLSMAADLRFTDTSFYIDNNNFNMTNIPKGGSVYTESNLMYINPVKLLFQSDKIYAAELRKKHLIDDMYNSEELMNRVLFIANRYSQFDYINIEAVKIFEHKNLRKLEVALQKENDFLMSCIRKKKNTSK